MRFLLIPLIALVMFRLWIKLTNWFACIEHEDAAIDIHNIIYLYGYATAYTIFLTFAAICYYRVFTILQSCRWPCVTLIKSLVLILILLFFSSVCDVITSCRFLNPIMRNIEMVFSFASVALIFGTPEYFFEATSIVIGFYVPITFITSEMNHTKELLSSLYTSFIKDQEGHKFQPSQLVVSFFVLCMLFFIKYVNSSCAEFIGIIIVPGIILGFILFFGHYSILKYLKRDMYNTLYALPSDLFEEELIMHASNSRFKHIFRKGALKHKCTILVVDKRNVYDYFCNRWFNVIHIPYINISTIEDISKGVDNNISTPGSISGAWINATKLKDSNDLSRIYNVINKVIAPNGTVLIKCRTDDQVSDEAKQRIQNNGFCSITINKQHNYLIQKELIKCSLNEEITAVLEPGESSQTKTSRNNH